MNARLLLVPAIAAAAALGYWLTRPAGVPAATWRTGTGTEIQQGRNYDELPPETPVRLSFTSDAAQHVYVFSHSDTDGTILLFPSPDVKSDLAQPLGSGQSVLPGRFEGKELAWTTRTEVRPTTTFVVVAAKDPIPELDALVGKVRRWTNSALTSRDMGITIPAGVKDVTAGPHQPLPDPLLQRAAELSLTATLVNGPLVADAVRADTWIGSWRVKEKAGEPKPFVPGGDPGAAPGKK
ncbi:MAG: hypothetical protein WAT39_20100 [Planctomycetota bacterium]